jgi:transcriptional regulator with XRE-family HTH domain
MPKKSTLNLPPLSLSDESFGHRLARLRKARGFTQIQLAHSMGLTQNLISAYECDRLGMQAEMLARFAIALEVSADLLLGLPSFHSAIQHTADQADSPSLPLLRRLKKIQALSPSHQKALLKTIDMFLKAAQH